MNVCETTAAVSALSIIISNCLTDDDEFALFALTIDQFSDTLNAMVLQRALLKK